MALGIVIVVLGFVLLVAGFMAFNHLVMLKHNVSKAWANVDVLLRQRHDELGKLIVVCAEYMRHERDVIERVSEARTQVAAARQRANAAAVGAADNRLRNDVAQLFALAEAYPALKADEKMLHLQRRITELENAIADRREFFNATVTINNVHIAQFPYSLFALAFGMRAFALFARDEPAAGPAGVRGRGRSR
jgi:LemA protein